MEISQVNSATSRPLKFKKYEHMTTFFFKAQSKRGLNSKKKGGGKYKKSGKYSIPIRTTMPQKEAKNAINVPLNVASTYIKSTFRS